MSADPIPHDEVVTVWTTAEGTPARLVWSERRFAVVAKPIAWTAHLPWWKTSTRVPRGKSSHVVERAMWQVQARAIDDGQLLIFDLAVTEDSQWPVTGIYD